MTIAEVDVAHTLGFVGLRIVTVVKNDPTGLQFTLDSVARQDAHVPLLIMDGGSTDSTLEVAEKFAREASDSLGVFSGRKNAWILSELAQYVVSRRT